MCEKCEKCEKSEQDQSCKPVQMASSVENLPVFIAPPTTQSSRRRRLWELSASSLCPVVGVCLPMPVLRKRLQKLLGKDLAAGDYELHCGVIHDCGHRSTVAEALQRELEQRYAGAIRLAAQHKTTEALGRWWAVAQREQDVAGVLWATLTHARCDEALQEQVLRDIHMLQHQVGSADRADLQRLAELQKENGVLGRELAQAQSRCTRLTQERAQESERLQACVLQLRAELLGRDTLLAGLRDELQQLGAAVPGLRNRQEQAEQIRAQLGRIHDLERALLAARQQQEHERRRADEAQALLSQALARAKELVAEDEEIALPELASQAVLCVGGRPSIVPIYRQMIERTGGRFLHHDGGEEDAAAKLDASLAAADLVICQTGCISHHAYWRVKDHCKRHNKRCVFVDKPSASSLQRALEKVPHQQA